MIMITIINIISYPPNTHPPSITRCDQVDCRLASGWGLSIELGSHIFRHILNPTHHHPLQCQEWKGSRRGNNHPTARKRAHRPTQRLSIPPVDCIFRVDSKNDNESA